MYVLAAGILPVHASQSQVNVRILKQQPRKEVLLGGMNQEWCVYDLHTHTHTHYIMISSFHKRRRVREDDDSGSVQYLKQLSVSQRLTHQLLHVATDNKQGAHNAHQDPGKDEGEAHSTEKARHGYFN